MLAEKVSGTTFGPIGDVIESVREIVELVNSPENAANDAASNLNSTLQDINRDASIQIGNSLQSVATGKDATVEQEQDETPSTEPETLEKSTPTPSAPQSAPPTEPSPEPSPEPASKTPTLTQSEKDVQSISADAYNPYGPISPSSNKQTGGNMKIRRKKQKRTKKLTKKKHTKKRIKKHTTKRKTRKTSKASKK